MSLQLRDYQLKALELLREGFAKGHRVQMLYLPCGGGKTETAITMLEAAKKKGSTSAMVLDRIVLCDQTSKRLDKYSIDHGVMQAGHWRYRPDQAIQVCSAQTIEKRGGFPGLTLLIVDEAHDKRQSTIDFIRNNSDIKVVGLSASPFTKGLGEIYTNVVSPLPIKDLVTGGSLVPLRVYIAKEIDMTGAKKIAGEWSEAEASKRGMKIVGDVVSEWIKKTHEIFGKPEKTIVFSSGVEHGNSLAAKFAEHGYNFVSLSYKDSDEYKKAVIEDFEKPDSDIIGVIACNLLSKGFDNPAVKIGVSARPFSKSFSSHVQQIGRIMRPYEGKEFCVWLDHAGNYLRFKDDWDDLFECGIKKLNDGLEKPRKEKTEKEKKELKCPACGALWFKGSDICHHCGYVRPKRSLVDHAEGELHELTGSSSVTRQDKQSFYSELIYIAKQRNYNSGWASHKYRDKFGVWPKGLDETPIPPSIKTMNWIKHKNIAYAKARQKAGT